MSAVDEMSQALAVEASLKQRLELALAVLERRLGVERSVIYSVNARSRLLEVVACHGLGAGHYRPRFGAGVVGRAAQSKQRIVVPEVRLEPMSLSELSDPDAFLGQGWGQAAIPLLSGKALCGVLSCYSLESSGGPLAASPEFSAVAALLAVVLERARQPEPGAEAADAAQRARPRDSVFEYANMVGASPAMRLIYEEIAQVARTNATTLIRGESGTGKELIAAPSTTTRTARRGAVRRGQLRGAARAAARVRAVRTRARRVHRRPQPPATAASSWRTTARCSWTRSASCRRRCRPSCCACCRSGSSSAWAATETLQRRRARRRGHQPRPGGAWSPSGAFREDLFYRLNVVHASRCRRCASAARTCRLLAEHFVAQVCGRATAQT